MLNRVTPANRHPVDPRVAFLLMSSMLSGLTLLISGAQPGSLAALVDESDYVTGWGVLLTVGASVMLVGLYIRTPLGVVLEQIGCIAVGAASLLYAVAILFTAGMRGIFPAALIIGWGFSLFWRWLQLQALMKTAEDVVNEAKDGHDEG